MHGSFNGYITGSNVQVGDKVVLIGDKIPLEEVAHLAGSSIYEILCSPTKRVCKKYSTKDTKHSSQIYKCER